MRKILLVLSAVSVNARLCDDWAGTPCYWPEGYKICCGPSELLMLIVLGLRVIDMDGGFKTIVLLRTFALIQTLHQRPVKYVIRTFRLGCR